MHGRIEHHILQRIQCRTVEDLDPSPGNVGRKPPGPWFEDRLGLLMPSGRQAGSRRCPETPEPISQSEVGRRGCRCSAAPFGYAEDTRAVQRRDTWACRVLLSEFWGLLCKARLCIKIWQPGTRKMMKLPAWSSECPRGALKPCN